MLKQKTKCPKRLWRRLLELCLYKVNNLCCKLWLCNVLSAIISVMLFVVIALFFAVACFDCFRELGCSWLCGLNIRTYPLGNLLANATNRLTDWLISIFCISEDGSLLVSVSADQLALSLEAVSLSLAPAQAILTTIGTGGVTLSAISEFRAQRYLGVSMRDVLRRYYPKHVCFIVMYVLLFVLGVYTMEQEMVRSSMLALSGVFLCCIYTIIFSFGAFSAEKLTRFYISGISNKIHKKHKAYRIVSILYPSLISNLAFYIGKEYAENSRELTDWFNSYSLTLSRILDVEPKGYRPEKQKLSLFKHSSWDERKIFRNAFCISNECCIKGNPEDFVFYRLLTNHNNQQSYVDCFGSKIKTLEIFWKNLFRPFGDDVEGKAQVAAAMLTASYIHSYSHFISMVCALSLHHHDIDSNSPNSCDLPNFLWQVLKHSKNLQKGLCENTNWVMQKSLLPHRFKSTQDEWVAYHKVLGLIELCVTLWENALHSRNAADQASIYNAFLEIADFTKYLDWETSRRELRLYLAYGYATYLMALPASSLFPSRNNISELLSIIEKIFYRKIRDIN